MSNTDDAITILGVARSAIDQAIAKLQPSGLIATPDQLDTAISNAAAGDSLALSPILNYPRALTIKKSIRLLGVSTGSGRVTKEEKLASFAGGIRVSADRVVLNNLEVKNVNLTTDILVNVGKSLIADRVRVLGDPVGGGKRAIAANGEDQTFVRCFVDDIGRVGQDTQAVCSWDAGPGLSIIDSYLGAAGQSVMLGGADSLSSARVPSKVTIQSCQLTKNPAWFGMGWQIKCALELKSCVDVLVDDCDLEYAGIAAGQGAFLIVATPRNQGGKAPWSSVQRVTVQHCRGRFAGGILNMLGTDDTPNNPSGPLDTLRLTDSSFTDIDPKGITAGAGRLFVFNSGPKNVTLDNLTVAGQNLSALGYFIQPAPGLTMTRLTMPVSRYGWKIDAGGAGAKALKAFMPDCVLDETIQ